jgi:3-isopropylmalate dehydrogenase
MLLDMSCGLPEAAAAVEQAVRRVLREGYRTGDIAAGQSGITLVGCREMGDLVAARIAPMLLHGM